MKVKVKLRFSAPSGGVLPGLEPTPPDYSGCNVRGLHHGATTPSIGKQKL